MRPNFTLYMHNHAQLPGEKCIGADPEIMFTCLLRSYGLDERADKDALQIPEDPNWAEREKRMMHRLTEPDAEKAKAEQL